MLGEEKKLAAFFDDVDYLSKTRPGSLSPWKRKKPGRGGVGGEGIFDYGDRDLNADNYASSRWKNVETRRIKEGCRGRPRLAIGCVFRVSSNLN